MFCAYCGKPIAQDSQYCAHCGKSVAPASQISTPPPTEWEYTYYRVSWASGKGGRYPLTFGRTEYGVRLDNWGQDQNWILQEVQEYLDQGWIPLSEVGPGGYHFFSSEDSAGGVKYTWLAVYQFLVEFRRPATPLSASEKQLVGVWEEAKDPNVGMLSKLSNALLWQKLEIRRWRYEFYKNRKFVRVSPDGTSLEGVYISSEASGFTLRFKLEAIDYEAILSGNRLICTAKGRQTREFERVDSD